MATNGYNHGVLVESTSHVVELQLEDRWPTRQEKLMQGQRHLLRTPHFDFYTALCPVCTLSQTVTNHMCLLFEDIRDGLLVGTRTFGGVVVAFVGHGLSFMQLSTLYRLQGVSEDVRHGVRYAMGLIETVFEDAVRCHNAASIRN